MLRYLGLSVLAGLAIFGLLFVGNYFLYNQFIRPNQEEKALNQAKYEFQSYVTSEELSSRDFISWQSDDGQVVYMNNTNQFPQLDSGNRPPKKMGGDKTLSINYSDKKVETTFMLLLSNTVYLIGVGLTIFLAVLFSILLFIRFLRRKIHYMHTIEEGTLILETGDLSYRLPYEGSDELTQIAYSINELSKALEKRITTEQRAVQTSKEIISDLSHDIRTPLTILMGYVPVLLETELTCEQYHYLTLIDKKTQQLNGRVNDLLEYATIFSGQQDLVLEEVEFTSFIEDFTMELSPFVPINVAHFEKRPFIVADKKLLGRLFDNLASNISTHADLTQPVLLHVTEEDENITLRIENTINQDDDYSMGKSLGVKIISVIAELHHGSLRVKEEGNSYISELRLPKKVD